MKLIQITNTQILVKIEESDNINVIDFIFPKQNMDNNFNHVMELLEKCLDKDFNIESVYSFDVETQGNDTYFRFDYDIKKSVQSKDLTKKLNRIKHYKDTLKELNTVIVKTNECVNQTINELMHDDEIGNDIKAKIVANTNSKAKMLSPQESYDYLRPSVIKKYLDDNVVAQEEAKKILAVAAHNHFKRVYLAENNIRCDKSNILLIGPSGCGKTELVKTLAKYLSIPFVIVDATSFTEAGYVGDDVESIIYRLYVNANNDAEKTKVGIVFIDEIDKLRTKNNKGVGDKGVQQSLLKLIEGTDVTFPADGRRNSMAPNVTINTDKILFICGGAFEGIIQDKNKKVVNRALGFTNELQDKDPSDLKEQYADINTDDLIKFGMIPELMGRLPIIARLNPLTQDDLVKILTEPVDSIINQYKRLFKLENIDLVFKEDALKAIASKVDSNQTGARNLRSVIEQTMLDIMYDIPDMISERKNISKCIINSDVIEKKAKPKITYHTKQISNAIELAQPNS